MRYASGDKAKRLLGYEPRVALEEGLKRSCLVRRLVLKSTLYTCSVPIAQLTPLDQEYANRLQQQRRRQTPGSNVNVNVNGKLDN